MSWQIFDKVSATGFQSSKLESIATITTTSGRQQWNRLLTGNSDGAIHLYECVQQGASSCLLQLDQSVKDAAKDKKSPATNLSVVVVIVSYFLFKFPA
jgi:hypothetical protein